MRVRIATAEPPVTAERRRRRQLPVVSTRVRSRVHRHAPAGRVARAPDRLGTVDERRQQGDDEGPEPGQPPDDRVAAVHDLDMRVVEPRPWSGRRRRPARAMPSQTRSPSVAGGTPAGSSCQIAVTGAGNEVSRGRSSYAATAGTLGWHRRRWTGVDVRRRRRTGTVSVSRPSSLTSSLERRAAVGDGRRSGWRLRPTPTRQPPTPTAAADQRRSRQLSRCASWRSMAYEPPMHLARHASGCRPRRGASRAAATVYPAGPWTSASPSSPTTPSSGPSP